MPQQQPRYTLDRVVRLVISGAVLAGFLLLLRYLSDVLIPFAAAVVLAYMLNPLVTGLERKTKHRGLAVALSLMGLGVIGLALLVGVLPLAYGQVTRFSRDVMKLRDDLAASAEAGVVVQDPEQTELSTAPTQTSPARSSEPETTPGEIDSGAETPGTANPIKPGSSEGEKSVLGWRELKEGWEQYRTNTALPGAQRIALLRRNVGGTYLGDLIDGAADYARSDEFRNLLMSTAKHLAVGGWSVLMFSVNVLLGLTGLIIVLLYLVFLLLDYPDYLRNWKRFLPPHYRKPIIDFLEEFDVALRRYFRGQFLIALAMGVLFSAGFSIINLPLAVPLGMFVGLLNMVPYLQTIGLIPGLLLAMVRSVEQGSSFAVSIVLVLGVFVVAQLIQDTLLTPRIMGKATGLRPVAILLGIFIWGKLLGFLGLIVAIPLTCLGIAYYERYVLKETASVPDD